MSSGNARTHCYVAHFCDTGACNCAHEQCQHCTIQMRAEFSKNFPKKLLSKEKKKKAVCSFCINFAPLSPAISAEHAAGIFISFKCACVTLLKCGECPESAVPTALCFAAFAVHQMTGKCGTVGAALCGMCHTVPALAHVAVRTVQHSTENTVILRMCNVGAWLVCDNGSGLRPHKLA